MSYEEKERKINIKWIIIIGIIVIVVGLFLIFLLTKKDSKKTVLVCSESQVIEQIPVDIIIKVYKKSHSYEISFNMKMNYEMINISEVDFKESIISSYLKNKLKDATGYYNYSLNFKNGYGILDIVFDINKDSELAYTKTFGINFLDYSVKDINDYFVKDGMICKEK